MIIAFAFTISLREIINQKYNYLPERLHVMIICFKNYESLNSRIMKHDGKLKIEHNWSLEFAIELLSCIISLHLVRFRDNKEDKLKDQNRNETVEVLQIEQEITFMNVQTCFDDHIVDKSKTFLLLSKLEIYQDPYKKTIEIEQRMFRFDSLISYWIEKNQKSNKI
jgi:hypothetical protein